MTQRKWQTDGAGNAVSGDWTTGWTNGQPGSSDFASLSANLVHPYTVTFTVGSADIGSFSMAGPGTLAVSGGSLTMTSAVIGDIVSPSLLVTGGTVEFGTARIAGLVQSAGHIVFDAAVSSSEVNGTFNISGGTISIGPTELDVNDDSSHFFAGVTNTVGGTIDGPGFLRLGSFDSLIFAPGLVLTVGALAFDELSGGSGTFALGGDLNYGGTIETGVGTVTIDLAGHSLLLANVGGLSASLHSSTGAGTVVAGGTLTGVLIPDSFTVIEVSSSLAVDGGAIGGGLRIDNGAAVTVDAAGLISGAAVVLGSLELGNGAHGPSSISGTGTVQIDAGTLTLNGIGSGGFGGVLTGAGGLTLGGSSGGTLLAGAQLAVASTKLSGTLTVAGSVNDPGSLAINGGYLIDNGTLTVGGLTDISNSAAIGGTGLLIARGGFTSDRLVMQNSVTLENAGTGVVSSITSGSSGLIGDNTGNAAIVNDAGATLDLSQVRLFNQNGFGKAATTLFNSGSIIANGASITLNVNNAGTIQVTGTSDVMQLGGTYTDTNPFGGLRGAGTVIFAGTKATFNVTPSTSVAPNFVLGGGTMQLTGSKAAAGALDLQRGLTMQVGSVLNLGQQNVDAQGSSILQGTITGTSYVTGAVPFATAPEFEAFNVTDPGTLKIAGNAILRISAFSTLSNAVTIGDNSLSTAVLWNGGTLILAAGAGISGPSVGGNSQLSDHLAPFTNNGLVLFATPGGSATIGVAVENQTFGTIAVAGGTLKLSGDIFNINTNEAALRIDADGTLELGHTVTAEQTISFSGPTGLLRLDAPSLVAASINMHIGDFIDLVGLNPVSWSYNSGTLTVSDGVHIPVNLSLAALDTGAAFNVVADGSGGALVTACFAAGTRIMTPHGEIAVQDLRVDDQVVLAGGGVAPVIWLGHRRIDCRRHARPHTVLPVRVRAHAFGPGRPHADLLLSPDHAVFVADVLIPVRQLINGATVLQEDVAAITYWHVELPLHDVLLAQGLPVESYLDTGTRSNFDNGGEPERLHPDFGWLRWEVDGCAPLVVSGPEVDAVRALLVRHAEVAHAAPPGSVAAVPSTVCKDTSRRSVATRA